MDDNLQALTRHLLRAQYTEAFEVLDKHPPTKKNMSEFVEVVNFTCHFFGSGHRPHADSEQAAEVLQQLLHHVPDGHPKLIDGLIEAIDVSFSSNTLADLYLKKGAINPHNTQKQIIELAWIAFQRPPHHLKQLKKHFTFPQSDFWAFVKEKGNDKHGFAREIENKMPEFVGDFFVKRDKKDLQKALKNNKASPKTSKIL